MQVSSVALSLVEGRPFATSRLTVVLQGFERHVSMSRAKGISHKPPSSPQVVLPVVQTPEVVQLAGGVKGSKEYKKKKENEQNDKLTDFIFQILTLSDVTKRTATPRISENIPSHLHSQPTKPLRFYCVVLKGRFQQ